MADVSKVLNAYFAMKVEVVSAFETSEVLRDSTAKDPKRQSPSCLKLITTFLVVCCKGVLSYMPRSPTWSFDQNSTRFKGLASFIRPNRIAYVCRQDDWSSVPDKRQGILSLASV
jgi:hypothetical protein